VSACCFADLSASQWSHANFLEGSLFFIMKGHSWKSVQRGSTGRGMVMFHWQEKIKMYKAWSETKFCRPSFPVQGIQISPRIPWDTKH
jgi:hypothetical protein